jgi:hypothetical protein
VSHLLTAAAIVAIVVAVMWSRRRTVSLLLAVLVVVQVALMFRTNLAAHLRSGQLSGLQGRYLFALLVPLAVLGALAVDAVARRRLGDGAAVRIALVTAAVGIALHALLVRSMLRGYWEAADANATERLGAVFAWSPLPVLATAVFVLGPIVVVIVGSFVVGFCVGRLTVVVIRTDGMFCVVTLRIDVAVSQNGEGEVVRPEVGYVVVHGGARGVGVTKSIVCVKLLYDDTQSALK